MVFKCKCRMPGGPYHVNSWQSFLWLPGHVHVTQLDNAPSSVEADKIPLTDLQEYIMSQYNETEIVDLIKFLGDYKRRLQHENDIQSSEDKNLIVSGSTRSLRGITSEQFLQYADRFKNRNLTVDEIKNIMIHTVSPNRDRPDLTPSVIDLWESLPWRHSVFQVTEYDQGQQSWQYIESYAEDQKNLPPALRAYRAFFISFNYGSNFADTEAEEEQVLSMTFKYQGTTADEVRQVFF